MASDGPGDVDLDLYADVEGGEFGGHDANYADGESMVVGGGNVVMGNNGLLINGVQGDNPNELYDDVMPTSANNDFPDMNPNDQGVSGVGLGDGTHGTLKTSGSYTGKRVSCYVGNLTWWTTDQDLTDAILAVGVQDLVEIKFYENKVNGQSKGFAVVTVGSDGSFRVLMDKLAKTDLHGQAPVVTFFSKHNLNQFEAQARKDVPNDANRPRNMQQNPPGLPLTRMPGGGILPRPQGMMPQGMNQQTGMGHMQQGIQQRPIMQQMPHGMQPGGGGQVRPGMQQLAQGMQGQRPMHGMPQGQRMGSGPMGMMQPGQGLMGRPQGPLISNPSGQGLMRAPPGHRMMIHDGARGPPVRQEWDRPPFDPNFRPGGPLQNRVPQPGTVTGPTSMPSGTHMNQGFYPGPPNGLMHHHHPGQMQPHGLPAHHHASVPTGQPQSQQQQQQQVPPNQQPGGVQSQIQPNGSHESPYYRPTPTDRPDIYAQQINEEEFQEIMEKNKTVSSSAISRAVTDASMGDYPSAIETLVMAISLIKQSKIANDDRCKILISSLQDTLKGIEDKYYSNGRNRSVSRDSRERPRRSRSRDSRERDTRRRDKHRHRTSRSRERRDYYDGESRYHRSRH